MNVHLRSIVGHDAGPHIERWRPAVIVGCFVASWVAVGLVLLAAQNWS